MHRCMKDVALAQNNAGISKTAEIVAAIEKAVYSGLDIIYDRFIGDKSKVDEAKKLFTDWKPIRDEVIALMKSGDPEKAAAITKEKGARHVAEINESITGFIDFAQGKADPFLSGAESAKSSALKNLYLVIILTMLAGALMAFFLTTGITGPLKTAVMVADKIAGGDLNQDIASNAKDETGMLLSSMKTMSLNLSTMIGELKTGNETLVKSSSELIDISCQMAVSSNHVTDKSATVSVASEQMSGNMISVAASIGQATTNISLVSSEITTLAQQTADATYEIRKKVVGIQSSARLTVTDISEITSVIKDVNDMIINIATSVEEQSITTRQIASNVSQASLGMTEVTDNVAQSSKSSEEVARDIVEVNASADEMNRRSIQVNTSAEVLAERNPKGTGRSIHNLIHASKNSTDCLKSFESSGRTFVLVPGETLYQMLTGVLPFETGQALYDAKKRGRNKMVLNNTK